MHSKSVHFAIVLAASSFARAEIRETASMRAALQALGSGSVLILDLDNTVLKPAQTLGSDQWFTHLVTEQTKAGAPPAAAVEAAIRIWAPVQQVTKVLPVESATPPLLNEVQRRGTKVMALTARPLETIGATVKQLASLGIDFRRSPVIAKDFTVPAADAARHAAGILFVGPKNDKGVVLTTFFRAIGGVPTSIVFVDDKHKHVRNMEDAMAKLPTRYVGFRYGATDREVSAFRVDIADLQLRLFKQTGRLVDDRTVARILGGP